MTPTEFTQWANSILRVAGIGTYDDGTPWIYYGVIDGDVCLCDREGSEPIDGWREITQEQLEADARAFLESIDADESTE